MERTNGFRSRKSFFAALLIVMAGAPFAAHAAPVTWYLVDVTFEDGATAFGSFTYDASLNQYSAISMATNAGPGTPTRFYFNLIPWPWTSHESQAHFTQWSPPRANFDPAMRFRFASPLTDAGGTIDLLLSPVNQFPFNSVEGVYLLPTPERPSGTISWQRRVVSGRVTSAPPAIP
jgi:hypothetical protein